MKFLGGHLQGWQRQWRGDNACPCPQVAEYVWHRRGLLALNLSRVDFLLGESLHLRVPWHQLGALGGPLSCSGVLGQLQCPIIFPRVLLPPRDGGTCPGHAGSPQRWFYFCGDAGSAPHNRSCYLPWDSIPVPQRGMLLLHLGMLVPPKEAAISLEMLVPHPGFAGVLSKMLLFPPWDTSPS